MGYWAILRVLVSHSSSYALPGANRYLLTARFLFSMVSVVSGDVAFALGLTILAGLSTGVGSAIAYLIREPRLRFLAFALGLSTGVMVYVSFVELLADAVEAVGEVEAVAGFFLGILVIVLIDFAVPEAENPHEVAEPGVMEELERGVELRRAGVLAAVAIGIHNFPEGLATFGTALADPALGVFIAGAIAIHNVPEGIAVSIPIYYATGDRRKAFLYSALSGVSEPIGAVVGFLVLRPFLTPDVLSLLLAFVAGVMVYVSLDELLPLAHRYGEGHDVVMGVVMGMLVMAVSLLYI